MVLTGQQHISVPQFSQTISDAYHQSILLHFDSMSGGGKVVNTSPKLPVFNQQLMAQCQANLGGGSSVNLLQQMGPMIQAYWAGASIVGPTGTVVVTSPGTWVGIDVPPNTNFNIILNQMITEFKVHLTTLVGIYTSNTVPGLVTGWSGTLLQCMP